MTLLPPAKGSMPVQKTTEIRRPRTNQRLTVSFDDPESDVPGSSASLQYELAQCVETKTVTTTTTTQRSYPPVFIRQPRPLEALDAKEYPLARGPTPSDLRKFTLDLSENDDEFAWSFSEPSFCPEIQVSMILMTVYPGYTCADDSLSLSLLISKRASFPILGVARPHLSRNDNLSNPPPKHTYAGHADKHRPTQLRQTRPPRGPLAAMQALQYLIGSAELFRMVQGIGPLGKIRRYTWQRPTGLKSLYPISKGHID